MSSSDSPLYGNGRDELAHSRAENARLTERVAELSKSNSLLAESTRRLTADADPEVFLESLVGVLADSIGASPVTLFEYDPLMDTLAMRIHYSDEQMRRGLCGDEVPLFAAPFPANTTPAWPAAVQAGGHFMVRSGFPETKSYVWPGLVEWMQRIGVTDTGFIALFIGNEPIGGLGISWTRGRKAKKSDFPLVEALARQSAVGLRLVKLADAARDAAVTLSQEKDARTRSSELVRANDALHRNTASLMVQKDARALLETVLLDACAFCGAMSATVFRHQRSADILQMAAFVTGGESVDLATDPRMEMWRRPFPTSLTFATAFETLSRGDVAWFDNEEPNPARWSLSVEWHRRMGHRIVAMIPTMVGRTLLGFVGLCFAEPVPPTPTRLEQARTFAGHAGLALQLARLTEDLRREISELASLAERDRIARDLHDTLAQGFTGILAQLGVVEGSLDGEGVTAQGGLRHALARAEELARSSLAEARRSVATMRAESPAPPGDAPSAPTLETALKTLLDFMTGGTRLHARIEVKPGLPELPANVEETLRRIVQEALTNSLKHAGSTASEFTVLLGCRENHVVLVARDNGCGFDSQSMSNQNDGFGLVGMRERAALAGGTMTLVSEPNSGVEITVALPFACEEGHEDK